MEELRIAKAEIEAELEKAKAMDIAEEIDKKVAQYKLELEAEAEAEKQAIIDEKQADLNAINRIIARFDVKPAEAVEPEAVAADKTVEMGVTKE